MTIQLFYEPILDTTFTTPFNKETKKDKKTTILHARSRKKENVYQRKEIKVFTRKLFAVLWKLKRVISVF